MKIAFFISRIITGLVFVFSGFVKAVDPVGYSIKITEYFQAFHLDFLAHMALPLAIILCAAELMLGLNLLAGMKMKLTAWLLILFMSFFTLLTFILAISNPVSDCGCFGDALILTNWQTFGKNIVILVPAIVVFIHRDRFNPVTPRFFEWGMTAFNFFFPCCISLYCICHQPVLDFRPYNTGTYIPSKMVIPEGAVTDQYETVLLYKKNGNTRAFTDKNFPWQDTTWKWVETRQKLIKKGYVPPIHDFSIGAPDGTDITGRILTDSGYIFLIIAPDLENTSLKGLRELNPLALKVRELGFTVYGLTSSANGQIKAYKDKYQPPYDFCTADETTLKTIIRSNPGVLLLHQGTILGKWNYRDAPTPKELNHNLLSVILLKEHRQNDKLIIIGLTFLILLIYSFAWLSKS